MPYLYNRLKARASYMVVCMLGLLTVLTALTGCGFTLKGTSKSLPFTALGVQIAANSTMLPELSAALSAKGVLLVVVSDNSAATLPRLILSDEQRDKAVLSTSTVGRVREYQLNQRVTMQLSDNKGNVWLDPVTFTRQRDFNYSDSRVLAKELEERTLYQTMQHELVLAILARLEMANELAPTSSTSTPQ
jgi:LPS-assembly lipoprotein